MDLGVVYHLPGQTFSSQFVQMVSNSGVVNFVPKSRLPLVKLSSVYPKNMALNS